MLCAYLCWPLTLWAMCIFVCALSKFCPRHHFVSFLNWWMTFTLLNFDSNNSTHFEVTTLTFNILKRHVIQPNLNYHIYKLDIMVVIWSFLGLVTYKHKELIGFLVSSIRVCDRIKACSRIALIFFSTGAVVPVTEFASARLSSYCHWLPTNKDAAIILKGAQTELDERACQCVRGTRK